MNAVVKKLMFVMTNVSKSDCMKLPLTGYWVMVAWVWSGDTRYAAGMVCAVLSRATTTRTVAPSTQ